MADRLDRRNSTTSQRTLDEFSDSYHDGFDMFANDYNAQSFPVVDGHQPPSLSRDGNQPSLSTQRAPSRRSVALQTNSSSFSDSAKKRQSAYSSNNANLLPRNSFSLRHDTQFSDPLHRMASMSSTSEMTEVPSARRFSTASRLSTPRPPSTSVGLSIPSHPYGIYPQNTSSNRQSTTSSYHPLSNRSLGSSQGPTHPYGMYPQLTDDASETDPLQSSSDITSVGFPGQNQQYARRLGPDGEEADDIIGPDGHTEQLPPYTRYPDGREAGPLPPKQRTTSALSAGARISHISLDTPQTVNSANSMSDALLFNQAPLDGVPEPLLNSDGRKQYSRRGRLLNKSKKRTCFGHLPVWAVILMLVLLVVVAAGVGAVIGRTLPRHNDNMAPMPGQNDSDPLSPAMVTMITTTIHDAAPLQTTASNIPPAPTGDFSLLMGAPSESSPSCVDSNQEPTWGCASGAFLSMNVSNPMWDAAQISVSNHNFMGSHGGILPGAVPPSFNGPVSASLMNDTNDPEFGPALFFYQPFDKVVVLKYPNSALNASTPTKRSSISLPDQFHELTERGSPEEIQEGQSAWVCYWNNTSLEGFIYVEKNASASANDTSAASSIGVTDAPQPTPPPQSPPSLRRRDSRNCHNNSTSHENSRSQNNSTSQDHGSKHNCDDKNGDNDNGCGHHHCHDYFSDKDKSSNGWPSNWAPPYPRVVKLQERRDRQTRKQAYCQVMQVQPDKSFAPAPGPPQIVNLTETDTDVNNEETVFVPNRRRSLGDGLIVERQNVANFCHCEWLSQ